MNVAELIAELQQCDQDAEVHFAYNYGDHWRTEVAPKVDVVELGMIKYSDYHRMPKVVEYDADDEGQYDNDNTNESDGQVVILR